MKLILWAAPIQVSVALSEVQKQKAVELYERLVGNIINGLQLGVAATCCNSDSLRVVELILDWMDANLS